MSTAPPPLTFQRDPGRLSPTEVTDGTYVVHQVTDFPPLPLSSYANTSVIQAEQPVIVDTGYRDSRAGWLEDVFSLVDAREVRWVFVSHADPDHAGNVEALLQACPNARLVCAPLFWECVSFELPPDTLVWARPSSGAVTTFDAGDREMVLVPPPRYDSPATMGLLDTKTHTYFSADAFGCFVPGGVAEDDLPRDVAQLDDHTWTLGMSVRAKGESPWLTIVDDDLFAAEAQRLADLEISTIVPAHSPAVTGDKVAEALAHLSKLPSECRAAPFLEAYIGQIWAATQAGHAEG